MVSQEVRIMAPPRRLKQKDIEILVEAAIESGLVDIDRGLLLQGIDRAVILGLKTKSSPLEQFQVDLNSLNQIDSAQSEETALVQFLRNAASQLRVHRRQRDDIFEQYATALCEPPPAAKGHLPPFVLAGLAEGVDVKFVPIPLTSPTKAHEVFFLSSSPVPVGKTGAVQSTEIDKAGLIRWLAGKRSTWPIRPPLLTEWKAAFIAKNKFQAALPIVFPSSGERCFWCFEENQLLARAYDGRIVGAGSADVWLIYELQR
jgi:hypothetical protein